MDTITDIDTLIEIAVKKADELLDEGEFEKHVAVEDGLLGCIVYHKGVWLRQAAWRKTMEKYDSVGWRKAHTGSKWIWWRSEKTIIKDSKRGKK